MTEVAPADRTKLLQSKRAECSAIARSRKRKLCILYEVTLSPDALPRRSFRNLDAYQCTTAERQFLDGCDILQGRTLNELNIPSRRRVLPHYAQHLPSQGTTAVPNENVLPSVKEPTAELPNADAQQRSLPQKPSATVGGAQPRPAPQTDISGPAKPAHSTSSTNLPYNVPPPGLGALPISGDVRAVGGKLQADEVPDKRLSPKATTHATASAQLSKSKALQPAPIPQPSENQIREQPPPCHSAIQADSSSPERAVPSSLILAQLAQPNAGRPATSPTVLDVPPSTKTKSTINNKGRNENAPVNRPSHTDHLARIGEQVEAQLVRDSISASKASGASQPVKTVGVETSAQPSLPPPTPHATVSEEPSSVISRDSSTANDPPSSIQQNVVEGETLNRTTTSEVRDSKEKSMEENAQQHSTTASISILMPFSNRDQRHKPVAEILGERPQSMADLLSPGDSQATRLTDKMRTKKGKMPTVFLVQNRSKPDQLPTGPSWMKPLDQLLHQAHKTACRILRRVYQLQHTDKWSLLCHWDIMLQEMKWMRTDFREERKWKMAAATASKEERKALQVNAVIPPPPTEAEDILMVDAPISQGADTHPTPDLIPSGGTDSPLEPDDELDDGFSNTIAPSAIFALQDDDIVFSLQPSAATDRLLEELPMYGSPLKVPKYDLTAPEYDPDASWKRPALPLSRFVEGRMELTSNETPRKKSRYQYQQEDSEDGESIFAHNGIKPPRLPPLNPNVALFRPENKSIKDRLHAGHQFRPPSDNMPLQAFYESRGSSQWTQGEDDELKSLVREYSYNWGLITSILSSKSMFVSGTDRRTPWECFERWVMLEGLPNDMQKTQYFKLWQSRIEQAQQHIRQQNLAVAQQQQAQQQAQQQSQQTQQPLQTTPNGPSTPLPRRRHSLPMKVERRRNQKHLTMIDGMRKLAKKREAAAQKQQQAAQLAAARKPADVTQHKAPTKTPREYSVMRWERDQAMAERLAERMAQQQRHEAQRRVRAGTNAAPNKANVQSQAAMQRAQQNQHAMAAAAQNAGQLPQGTPQMAAAHPHAGMARGNNQNHATANSQARPRMPMPMVSTPTGTEHQNHLTGSLVPPVQMNGSPQIQMPVVNGQAQMTMPGTAHNMHMLLQARRISEQQRQSVQMRQQQQHHPQHQQQQQPQHQPQSHPQQAQPHQQQQQLAQQQSQQPHVNQQTNPTLQNSPPAMRAAAINGLNQKNYLNNAQVQAMMASFNAANGSGLSTPPAAGFSVTPGQAGSPRPNVIIPPQHQTYLAQLQAIENQIRSNHPETPQDRVREMAKTYLQNRHNSLTQSAMNAAAGSPGQAAAANGPHQYAQLLRAQQQQQAAAAAAAAQAQAQAQAQQAQGPQQSAQHHRNSSGSATPTPSNTK
ncbi:hypothetical protein F4782DRAFT_540914 [Xylaria castorea]|nr:hypothetical protein F4782DRAFT_540914 [Xylaria castorea]